MSSSFIHEPDYHVNDNGQMKAENNWRYERKVKAEIPFADINIAGQLSQEGDFIQEGKNQPENHQQNAEENKNPAYTAHSVIRL